MEEGQVIWNDVVRLLFIYPGKHEGVGREAGTSCDIQVTVPVGSTMSMLWRGVVGVLYNYCKLTILQCHDRPSFNVVFELLVALDMKA